MLKIKQEASGYPAWVESEEEKDRYLQDYYDKEGIRLDKNNIKSNSGLKALSKLFLNSQWGRYAMQTLKIRTLSEAFHLRQYLVASLDD